MARPIWQDLNAYVDGELPADAAAEIAAAVAGDRELAAQVAALAQLKAAAGNALAVDPAEVPPLRLVRAAATPISWRWPARAAAALLVVLSGIAGWSAIRETDATRPWLAAPSAQHLRWLAEEASPAPMGAGAVLPAMAPGAPERVPDLGFARLMAAQLVVDASGPQPGLYVGYVGVNGCRLGLWIGPADGDLAAALVEHRDAALHSFTWRIGNTGYAVMARNMDEQRLAAIARRLEQLTRAASGAQVAAHNGNPADAPCVG